MKAKNGYLEFCEKLNKKRENDKEIEYYKLLPLHDFRDRINFNIHVTSTCPPQAPIINNTGTYLFTLDSEDLDYLYNKYSKKLEWEKKQNIEEINKKYKKFNSEQ